VITWSIPCNIGRGSTTWTPGRPLTACADSCRAGCETGRVQEPDVLTPGSADASVRPARAADVPAIAAVQVRAWRRAYAGVMPAQALAQLDGEVLQPRWLRAVTAPPTPRHGVLVACSGSLVVGFAAMAPCADPDAGPTDAELLSLEVDPAHQRTGHGSRLLGAVADTLRGGGFGALRVWCPVADEARRAFLMSAGLRPDGGYRSLRGDGGADVAEERLAAALPS
jgi:ribosomal protein S18 acetylase RimI-like enzyme